MERNKRGISLIVLVITIIVMIVLAGTIIISLSSTNIIDRANNAVSDSNLKQVQSAATLAWADAYLDNVSDIEGYIIDKLEEQGIDTDKYTVVADKSGVEVSTGWLLKKTIANGKVTEVVVKKGKQVIEVGSTVNYMPDGVGDTNYTGGWKVLGVDDDGRLLIMSADSITGSTITLGGATLEEATTSYKNALTTLQNAVNSYKDGTIGVEVRSVKVEDIDALTSFNKTTCNAGQMNAYGNEVTYEWNGTEYPVYSYGKTIGKSNKAHSSGFTYYDTSTGEVATSAYIAGETRKITTVKSNFYSYESKKYLLNTTLAYKMLFRNTEDSANTKYWLATCSLSVGATINFGVCCVTSGYSTYSVLFSSIGGCKEKSNSVRAVVTLSSNSILTESTTSGIYDITLAE